VQGDTVEACHTASYYFIGKDRPSHSAPGCRSG
jgi:TRAP-type mannitol/chloroaromatic compound transport system substrate-binding protein